MAGMREKLKGHKVGVFPFLGIRALSLEARAGKVWFSLVQLGFGMARYSSVHYPWGGKGRRGQEADRGGAGRQAGRHRACPLAGTPCPCWQPDRFHAHTHIQKYKRTEILKYTSTTVEKHHCINTQKYEHTQVVHPLAWWLAPRAFPRSARMNGPAFHHVLTTAASMHRHHFLSLSASSHLFSLGLSSITDRLLLNVSNACDLQVLEVGSRFLLSLNKWGLSGLSGCYTGSALQAHLCGVS